FPDCGYTWRHQLPALAAAGFHAVAPDMRGYDGSWKPKGVASYSVRALAKDVAGLVTAFGAERADVVAHDWGGGAAWTFGMLHPDRLRRLAILNAPHPVTFQRHLRSLQQLKRSWYMFAFQLPVLPEAGLARNDFASLRKVFRTASVRPGAFSDEDIERHLAALRPAGTLTAALNYYRAAFRNIGPNAVRPRRVDHPTLVLWGDQDRFLGPELAEPGSEWVPNVRIRHVPEAGHWIQHDVPELVNDELVRFFG
ncbi:MAG TPA: alpha/beta hydrolase, partial [Candidatus Limnocylindria bacterium]|nr:alpha/beta hydrolase [Candidatus Limnocylindria bacterium]